MLRDAQKHTKQQAGFIWKQPIGDIHILSTKETKQKFQSFEGHREYPDVKEIGNCPKNGRNYRNGGQQERELNGNGLYNKLAIQLTESFERILLDGKLNKKSLSN